MATTSSRKRSSSQRAETLEHERVEQQPRLLLKSYQKESGLFILEKCLDAPEDEVIDSLLLAFQLLLCRMPEDWEEAFELIKRLWLKYNNVNSVISAVMVNMLLQFLPEVPCPPVHHLEYLLSMFENGHSLAVGVVCCVCIILCCL